MDSHPFRYRSICPPIPDIWLFQNLTMEILGERHNLRWHDGPNILSSHPFCSMSVDPPISEIQLFQNWPWKSKVKVIYRWGQSSRSHSGCNIQSTHILFVPCWLTFTFLRYSYFNIWLWKSKVKDVFMVKVQGHIVGPTSYQLTSLSFHIRNLALKKQGQGHMVGLTSIVTSISFYVNRPSRSSDIAISKFDLENPRSRSWVRSKVKVTQLAQHPFNALLFCFMSIESGDYTDLL